MYSLFKISSEKFSIDLVDFKEIFKADEVEFSFWDSDKNGLIDSFELFTGLILFSEASPEDRYTELFNIFDFNENGGIYFNSFIFMLENMLSSSIKMYRYKIEINIDEIESYLSNLFKVNVNNNDFVLTLSDFKEFIQSDNLVKEGLEFFNLPQLISITNDTKNENINLSIYNFKNIYNLANLNYERGYLDYFSFLKVLSNMKLFQNYQLFVNKYLFKYYYDKQKILYHQWINKYVSESSVLKKTLVKNKDSILRYCADLSWVYGINLTGISSPIQYINKNTLIYSVGKIVIIFNVLTGIQSYYLYHKFLVNCIALGKNGSNIVASSELSIKPDIHIWYYPQEIMNNNQLNKHNMKCIKVLSFYHKNSVHLMEFTENNKFLITIGLNVNSGVLVYDWNSNNIVFSFYLNEVAQCISYITAFNSSNDLNEDNDITHSSENKSKFSNKSKSNLSNISDISNIKKNENKKKNTVTNNEFMKYSRFILSTKPVEFICICTDISVNLIVIKNNEFYKIKNSSEIDINSSIKVCLMIKTLYNQQGFLEDEKGLFFNYNDNYEEIIIVTGSLNGDVNSWAIIDNNIEYLSKNIFNRKNCII